MDIVTKSEPVPSSPETESLMASLTKATVPPTPVAQSPKLPKGKRASPDTSSELGNGKWTDEEHKRFLQALDLYGNCWKKVEEYVGTRSCAQIRSHCQKYFRRLRNKTLQELKRTGQLKGKVFIVTKEYYNYSGCAHQPIEPELRTSVRAHPEPGSTKTEDQKDPIHFALIDSPCQEMDQEPRFEIFDEPKAGGDFEEGLFESRFGFCEDGVFPYAGNQLAFSDEFEEYDQQLLARVPYEA